MSIKCIVLKVFIGCKLVTVNPLPLVSGDKDDIHASLELARKAKVKFEEHIDCGLDSPVWTELGFGKVDSSGNVTL